MSLIGEGEKVAKGQSEVIIDDDTQAKIMAIFGDPERNKGGGGGSAARKYLLSGGLLVCGMPGCGKPLQSQPSNSGARGFRHRHRPVRVTCHPPSRHASTQSRARS
ncbi:hypothetical protein [Streptosporangium sp. NPDC000396]|uniref:hypothetical protein n=1 Tax=Streptosporangium sp. NPDC000396 TaxID=3366185 RepID=UPI0036A70095